ncbi:MAG: hypothetical protein ACRDWA_15460 [Acidimicrobiia bacterium]
MSAVNCRTVEPDEQRVESGKEGMVEVQRGAGPQRVPPGFELRDLLGELTVAGAE